MEFVGKILPVDGYRVHVLESFPIDYDESLIHLYQPLIGIEATSLYEVLYKESALKNNEIIQTHHTLMNYLNIPLDQLYRARLKLEGIGLLKTYKKTTEEQTMFTYLLQAPFRPAKFFEDLMLSEFLYRHVGKAKFTTLKNHYSSKVQVDMGEELTASFKDVFQSFRLKHRETTMPTSMESSKGIPLPSIDFSMVAQWLTRRNVPPNQLLTDTNKRIMIQLIELYDLEMYELEQAINWALTEENELDIEQLKAACHDLFQGKQNVVDVGLYEKERPIIQPIEKKPLSKEEQLIQRLENISPKQLLEDLSAGKNASEADMAKISHLMIEQGIPVPVMNVAIYYVLLQSEMRLSQKYLETIVSNWSRLHFKTAREAMAFAKKQINQSKEKPKRRYYPNNKQSNKKEVLPTWFKDQKENKQVLETDKPVLTKKQKEEQEQLLAQLQEYGPKDE